MGPDRAGTSTLPSEWLWRVDTGEEVIGPMSGRSESIGDKDLFSMR